jgi:uncharacterized protein YjbJ (UPF0337 family)
LTAEGRLTKFGQEFAAGSHLATVPERVWGWRDACSPVPWLVSGLPVIRNGKHMNWDQIEGKWKQLSGSARERWGKLSDDDWQTIAGKKDQLVGRIQERYGIAKAEAETQADEWCRALRQSHSDTHLAGRL